MQLLGCPKCIGPDTPYDVDSDVQLVCKYLRAYKQGMIDRLHRDGRPEVKFSTDPVLSSEECHSLLKQYMPEHISSTKITQHLFIKLVTQ